MLETILEILGISDIWNIITSIGNSIQSIKETVNFYVNALFAFNPVIGGLVSVAFAAIFVFAIFKLIKAVVPAA